MDYTNYLGSNGLTATSANHIANIAKEIYESLETKLNAIRLYNKKYALAINGQEYTVEKQSDKSELLGLDETIKQIARLKSLIAWLREAIKAKDKLNKPEFGDQYIDELIKAGRTELEYPTNLSTNPLVDFKQVFDELSETDKVRYYSLEAKCAEYGKYIHPDGTFHKARTAFYNVQKNPVKVTNSGQDAEISTFVPGFTNEEVDSVFFALQKEYRSVQAEFNSMKFDIESAVMERNKKISEENEKAKTKYYAERDLVSNRRDAELLKYGEIVKELKIVIPENLKGVYEEVQKVASAK